MPPPSRRRRAAAAAAVAVATITSKEECGECSCVVTTFSDGRVCVEDVSLEILVSLGMSYKKEVCATCGRVKHVAEG